MAIIFKGFTIMSVLFRAFFSFVIVLFLCAQPVFAVDGLTAAFTGIAHDPTGNSLDSNQQVQVLQDFAKGTKTQQEAISIIKGWGIDVRPMSFVCVPDQDTNGNNLAHKLLSSPDVGVEDMVKLVHIFGDKIWAQKNKDGLTPFEVHPEKLTIALQNTDGLYSSNNKLWQLLEIELKFGVQSALRLSLGADYKFSKNPKDVIWGLQQKQSDVKYERQRIQEEQQRENEDIETLHKFMRGKKSSSEAMWAIENLSGNAVVKPTILALRDSQGNNLAHRFLEHSSYGGVSQITTLIDFGGIDLFNQTNKGGLTPIAAYPKEFAGLLEPLVDYSTLDPVTKDYSALQPYPDTHPERQAQLKLQKLLKPAAERYVQDVVERVCALVRDNSDYHEKLNEFFHIVNGFIKAYGSQISIPLERITDPTFYAWLANEQEGKAYMLNYKVNGKESLYNYFSKHDVDGDVRDISSRLLPLYFEKGTPSASEVDLQRLEHTYWIGDLIKTSKYLKAYKNSRGENLASIALRSNDNHLFQEVVNVIPELLRATSSEGTSPLMLLALARPEQYYDYSSDHAYESYYDYLVSKTPSLALEKDLYGNTMGTLHSLSQSHDEMMVCDFFANIFKAQTLGAPLWERIIDHPYIRAFEHRLHGGAGFVMLYTALNQTQTPLHQSFFQKNLDRRDEVNQLWKALFAASDRQNQEEHGMPKIHDAMKVHWIPQIRDAVKVLELAGFAQQTMLYQAQDQDEFLRLTAGLKFKTLQTLQSKLLSTGGTFGMNFHRSANFDEIYLMIQSLQSLGRTMQDPNEIIRSLVVSYSSALTKDQQEKLDDHQINCAVLALKVIVDFDEIDRLLTAKFHGASINSAERFHKFEEAGLIRGSHHSSRRSSFDGSDGEGY